MVLQTKIKPTIAIIGYGKVGRILIRAFINAGYALKMVVDSRSSSIDSSGLRRHQIPYVNQISQLPQDIEFLLICVPDNAIMSVVHELVKSPFNLENKVIAHTAGAFSHQILNRVRESGALPLAWHPFQTFTGDEGQELLHGITIGMDGDPEAIRVGERIAIDLGAIPLTITPEMRPLYHLSGVFACNFMTALAGISVDMLMQGGMDERQAYQALGPLMTSTVRNIVTKGLPEAITGPLIRGDDKTIEVHQQVLADNPQALEVYRMLSRVILKMLGKDEVGGIKV